MADKIELTQEKLTDNRACHWKLWKLSWGDAVSGRWLARISKLAIGGACKREQFLYCESRIGKLTVTALT